MMLNPGRTLHTALLHVIAVFACVCLPCREAGAQDDSAVQTLRSPAAELIARASGSLAAGPFSVLQKTGVAPGGDKHDFLTMSPYLWPNPKKPAGLPYVRRDGRLNPEASFDRIAYFKMSRHVQLLSLAWKHTRQEDYVKRCSRHTELPTSFRKPV